MWVFVKPLPGRLSWVMMCEIRNAKGGKENASRRLLYIPSDHTKEMAARAIENRKFSRWFTIQLVPHLGLHHFRKQATHGCHNIGRRTDIQDAGQWAANRPNCRNKTNAAPPPARPSAAMLPARHRYR